MSNAASTPQVTKSMEQILSDLAVRLDVMEGYVSRLRTVTGALEVDPPSDSKENTQKVCRFSEGYLQSLEDRVERLRSLNASFEYQLSRLEKHI